MSKTAQGVNKGRPERKICAPPLARLLHARNPMEGTEHVCALDRDLGRAVADNPGDGCAHIQALTWMARTLRARRMVRDHLRLAQDPRLGSVRMGVHRALAREWRARVR